MKTLSIETGRTYDFKQVLECQEVNRQPCEIFGGHNVIFNVTDKSRKMDFYVNVHQCEFTTDDLLSRQILDSYDTGDYENGHFKVS